MNPRGPISPHDCQRWCWWQKYPCPRTSVTKIHKGTGRVAKRVFTGIINAYLTTYYYINTYTDLIVSYPRVRKPDNKLSKLLKYLIYLILSYLILSYYLLLPY